MNREGAKVAKGMLHSFQGPLEDLYREVMGACIEVHRALGPGLLESVYEACLVQELRLRDIPFQRQLSIPVSYKGLTIDCGYRIDLLVDQQVVVELKAQEKLLPIHDAQLLTYMRLTGTRLGLLANFHHETMKDGLRRMVLDYPE